MTLEEALEWLNGERSSWNLFVDGTSEAHVLCARADAGYTEQAYWVVRAHREGLVPVKEDN